MVTLPDIQRTEDELHQSLIGENVTFNAGWDILLNPLYGAMIPFLKALYVIFGSYAVYYIGLLGIFIIGLVRG